MARHELREVTLSAQEVIDLLTNYVKSNNEPLGDLERLDVAGVLSRRLFSVLPGNRRDPVVVRMTFRKVAEVEAENEGKEVPVEPVEPVREPVAPVAPEAAPKKKRGTRKAQ